MSFSSILILFACCLSASAPLEYDIELSPPTREDLRVVRDRYLCRGDRSIQQVMMPAGGTNLLRRLDEVQSIQRNCLGRKAFFPIVNVEYFGPALVETAKGLPEDLANKLNGVLSFEGEVPSRLLRASESGERRAPAELELDPGELEGYVYGHISNDEVDGKPACGWMPVGWLDVASSRSDHWWVDLQPWTSQSPFRQGYLVVCYFQNIENYDSILNFVGYSSHTMLGIYRLIQGVTVSLFDICAYLAVNFCLTNPRLDVTESVFRQNVTHTLRSRFLQNGAKSLPFYGENIASWAHMGTELALFMHKHYRKARSECPGRKYKFVKTAIPAVQSPDPAVVTVPSVMTSTYGSVDYTTRN